MTKSLPPLPVDVKALFDGWVKNTDSWKRRDDAYAWLNDNRGDPNFIPVAVFSYIYSTDPIYGKIFNYRVHQQCRTRFLRNFIRGGLDIGSAKQFVEALPKEFQARAQAMIVNHFSTSASDQHTLVSAVSMCHTATKGQLTKIFSSAVREGNLSLLTNYLEPQYKYLWDKKIDSFSSYNLDFITSLIEVFPEYKLILYPKLWQMIMTASGSQSKEAFINLQMDMVRVMVTQNIRLDTFTYRLYIFHHAYAKKANLVHEYEAYWQSYVEADCLRIAKTLISNGCL